MMRKHVVTLAVGSLGFLALPAHAQIARDPLDKMVASNATGAAENYQGQPWWAALGECTATFITAENEEKAAEFATEAIQRIAEDRKMKIEDARDLVRPWIMSTGRSRSNMLAMAYGKAAVAKHCDEVMTLYKAR